MIGPQHLHEITGVDTFSDQGCTSTFWERALGATIQFRSRENTEHPAYTLPL